MYNTLNNPSAHPSYSHYYLLSPSTLFFLFLYILLFFAHLFCSSYCLLHILLFFAHLIVLHFFYFIAHFTLISPFLTICMPLCYVTLYNLYSYYFALSTERTWFDYISLLIIPCITIMWQIKKPWTLIYFRSTQTKTEVCSFGFHVVQIFYSPVTTGTPSSAFSKLFMALSYNRSLVLRCLIWNS